MLDVELAKQMITVVSCFSNSKPVKAFGVPKLHRTWGSFVPGGLGWEFPEFPLVFANVARCSMRFGEWQIFPLGQNAPVFEPASGRTKPPILWRASWQVDLRMHR